eukprot:COSAG06_NODE_1862_length_8199_cov_7.440741_2_plen_2345_part_00
MGMATTSMIASFVVWMLARCQFVVGQTLVPNGAACTEDADCESFFCDGGTCADDPWSTWWWTGGQQSPAPSPEDAMRCTRHALSIVEDAAAARSRWWDSFHTGDDVEAQAEVVARVATATWAGHFTTIESYPDFTMGVATRTCALWKHLSGNLGGALYMGGGELSVTGSSFVGNTANAVNALAEGGAIYVDGGALSVTGSSFVGNAANAVVDWDLDWDVDEDEVMAYGGAIYVNGGALNVTGSSFVGNTADYGGAILMSGGELSVTGSSFVGNTADSQGGAIYVEGGALSVTGSSFVGNTAFEWGGAIYMDGGELSVTGSSFVENTAVEGGAILVDGGALSVTGSSFVGNTADSEGGAILVDGGALSVTGSSFVDNTAGVEGHHILATGTADRVYIYNSSYDPLIHASVSVAILSGCEEHPCDSSNGFVTGLGCTYRNFSLSCEPCPTSLYSPKGISCTSCAPGSGPSNDQSSCEPCQGSEYSPSGTCMQCSEPNVVNAARTECTKCDPGQGSNADRTACVCAEGYYDSWFGHIFCYEQDHFVDAILSDEYNTARVQYESGQRCVTCPECVSCEADDQIPRIAPGWSLSQQGRLMWSHSLGTNTSLISHSSGDTATGLASRHDSIGNQHQRGGVQIDRSLFLCTVLDRCAPPLNLSTYTSSQITACSEGHAGPLCGTCSNGYEGSFNGMCTPCQPASSVWASIVIVCVLVLTVRGVYLKTKAGREAQQLKLNKLRRDYALVQRAIRHVRKLNDESSAIEYDDSEQGAFQSLLDTAKIIIGNLQIIAQLPVTLQFTCSACTRFKDLARALRTLNLDILRVASMECMGVGLNLYSRSAFTIGMPLLCVGLLRLWGCYQRSLQAEQHPGKAKVGSSRCSVNRNRQVHPEQDVGSGFEKMEPISADHRDHTNQYSTLIIFLSYPTVSSTIFAMFSCRKLDFSESWHVYDASIDCTSTYYQVVRVFFLFLVLLIPLGVPARFAYLLFRNRKALQIDTESSIDFDVFARTIRKVDADSKHDTAELKRFFHEIDRDKNQFLTFDELCRYSIRAARLHDPYGMKGDAELRAFFSDVDANRDGMASIDEMRNYLASRAHGQMIDGKSEEKAGVEHEANEDAKRVLERFSFLCQTYEPQFYYWEIVTYVKKLLLAGILIFVEPGSTTQLFCGCFTSFFFFAALARATPYKSSKTDRVALISEANLFVTLLCLLMMKINLVGELLSRSFYDSLLFYSNIAAALLPVAVTGIIGIHRLVTEWHDCSAEPLKHGDLVRLLDCPNPQYRGRLATITGEAPGQTGDSGREAERYTLQLLVGVSKARAQEIADPLNLMSRVRGGRTAVASEESVERVMRDIEREQAAVHIQAVHRGRTARGKLERRLTLKRKQTMMRDPELAQTAVVRRAPKSLMRSKTHNALSAFRLVKGAKVDRCCGRDVRVVEYELSRNEMQRVVGRRQALDFVKVMFGCVKLVCKASATDFDKEHGKELSTDDTRVVGGQATTLAPEHQNLVAGGLHEEFKMVYDDVRVIHGLHGVKRKLIERLKPRVEPMLTKYELTWEDVAHTLSLINFDEINKALHTGDPDELLTNLLISATGLVGKKVAVAMLRPHIKSYLQNTAGHSVGWDDKAINQVWGVVAPVLESVSTIDELKQALHNPEQFLDKMMTTVAPVAKVIALAKLRPQMQKWADANNYDIDALAAAVQSIALTELTDAIANPDALWQRLLHAAGTTGRLMLIAKLRSVLEDRLPQELAWEDIKPTLELISTVPELTAALDAPETFLNKLMDSAGPVAKTLAAIKLRPKLELALAKRHLAWQDIQPALELVDSAEELEAAVLDPEAFLSRLESEVGPVAQRLAIGKLRLYLEPVLSKSEITWEDALPVLNRVDSIEELQAAVNDPSGLLQTLLTSTSAAATAYAVVRLRPYLEPVLVKHGMAWDDIKPTLELISTVPELTAALDAPETFLNKLMDSAGPVAKTLAAIKLRPKLELALAKRHLAWQDIQPALELVDSAEELEAAVLDPEAFLSRLESEVGPMGQRLATAKLRPPEPPPSDDTMSEHILQTLVPTRPRPPPRSELSAGRQRPQRANSQSVPDPVINVGISKALQAAEAHVELQASKDAAATAAVETAQVHRDTQSELKEAQRRIAELEVLLEQSRLAAEEEWLERERITTEQQHRAAEELAAQSEQARLADLADRESKRQEVAERAEQERITLAAEQMELERAQAEAAAKQAEMEAEERRQREEDEHKRREVKAAQDKAVDLVEASLKEAKAAASAEQYDEAVNRFTRGLAEADDPNVPSVWVEQLKLELQLGLSEAQKKADQARFRINRDVQDASATASVDDAKEQVRKMMGR